MLARVQRGGVLGWRPTPADQRAGPVVAPVPVPRPGPEQEPHDLTACLAGPNGLDLVVELAHDLRSPLTSILFLAEALQQGQGGKVTPEQSRQLGLIYSAALCLCATASDVLELARGGNRLVDRAPGPFSVAETFESVRSMIQPIAEEKGVAIRLVHPVPDPRLGAAFLPQPRTRHGRRAGSGNAVELGNPLLLRTGLPARQRGGLTRSELLRRLRRHRGRFRRGGAHRATGHRQNRRSPT